MNLTKEDVREALKHVADPQLRRDIITLGALKHVAMCDGVVSIRLHLPGAGPSSMDSVRAGATSEIQAAARNAGDALKEVRIEFVDSQGSLLAGAPAQQSPPEEKPAPPQQTAKPLPGVKHVVAVGAGKGGVGKSTISVNFAVGLARRGYKIGLMDGDIYGPSLPTLLGLGGMEAAVENKLIQPFNVHGIRAVTIGKLVDEEKPLIWRGPMAHGAFKQLVEQTEWGELDYLIIDLPPGTGDVCLTMAQCLSLDGGVIVCTPQKVAQDDAVRAARMFQTLGIDVLGVVENMSYFMGDDNKEYDIFGRGGAERMAQRLDLPFLGALPIHMSLRQNSDEGNPSENFGKGAPLNDDLEKLITQLENQIAAASLRADTGRPTLTVR